MSAQDQSPRSSTGGSGASDINGVPDPTTDPVTGPIVARLERFYAATTVEPPADLAAGIRARLARERAATQRPTGLSLVSPRHIAVTFRRNAGAALGRQRVPLSARIRSAVMIAVLVVVMGAVGITAVALLRSTGDRVGGPATPSPVPSAWPSPSVEVPTASPHTSVRTVRSAQMSARRDSIRRNGRPNGASGRASRSVGQTAVSSPNASPRPSEPAATPEVTAEPTLEPRRTPRTTPIPEPTSQPTDPPPGPTPDESAAPLPSPNPG